MIVFSQLKSLASKDGLVLSKLVSKNSGTGVSDLIFTSTTFEATGDESLITTFLKDIETMAPITLVNNINSSLNNGIATSNIVTNTYWAPYPKIISTITEPVTDMTSVEKETLTKTQELTSPTFSQITPSVGDNITPFGE